MRYVVIYLPSKFPGTQKKIGKLEKTAYSLFAPTEAYSKEEIIL